MTLCSQLLWGFAAYGYIPGSNGSDVWAAPKYPVYFPPAADCRARNSWENRSGLQQQEQKSNWCKLNFIEFFFCVHSSSVMKSNPLNIVNIFIVFLFISIVSFCFCLLGVESSKVVESQLADFLVFLRRVLSLRVMKRLSTFVKWTDPLMAIISHKCSSGKAI